MQEIKKNNNKSDQSVTKHNRDISPQPQPRRLCLRLLQCLPSPMVYWVSGSHLDFCNIWPNTKQGLLGDELDQILKKLNIRSCSCYKSILRQSVSDFDFFFYKIRFINCV